MGILDFGAGASAGLEKHLAAIMQQQQMARQQQQLDENIRSNKMEEAYREKALGEQTKLRTLQAEQLATGRQSQELDRDRDVVRARELLRTPEFIDSGAASDVSSDEYSQAAKLGVLPMSAYSKETPFDSSTGFQGPIPEGEPRIDEQVIKFRGTGPQRQAYETEQRRAADAATAAGLQERRVSAAEKNAERGPRPFMVRPFVTDDGLQLYDPNTQTFSDSGQGVAPTANTRDRQAAGRRVLPIMNAVSELADKINVTFGPGAKVLGAWRELEAKANLDDDVAEYKMIIKGFAPTVARALGHTGGQLTQLDIESVYEVFPHPGDSKTLKDRKIKRVISLLSAVSDAEQPASVGAGPAGSGGDETPTGGPEQKPIPGIPGGIAEKGADGKWIRVK